MNPRKSSLIINSFVVILFFIILVIPNSFTNFSFTIQSFLALIIIINKKFLFRKSFYFFWFLISTCFTFFIIISKISTNESLDLFLRYVISPFTWLIIFYYLKVNYSEKNIINVFILFGFISAASVTLFYFLFLNGNADFMKFIVDTPNVESKTGLGFRLHVYGSLIFFAASIIPTLIYIDNLLIKIIYFLNLTLSTILSGRTALVVILLLGISMIIFYKNKIKFVSIKSFIIIISNLLFLLFFYYLYKEQFSYDFFESFQMMHIDKFQKDGDQERSIQLSQIVTQILNNPLGSGFIELKIQRNDINHWQYETLIPAFVMRYGIITFLIVLTSIYFVFSKLQISKKNEFTLFKQIFLSGFLAIIIASFSNPYLESPTFQWMYIGPLVLLFK